MKKWFEENMIASILLAILRIYLGFSWLSSGWSKATGEGFTAEGFLKGALGQTTGDHPSVLPFWGGFLENVALPNVGLFNFLVVYGEIAIGIALIIGLFTRTALIFSLIMNFSFMFSGSTGVNPYYVLYALILLIGGRNTGKYGVDGLIIAKRFGNRARM
ncbi:MAG: DoxX [Bacillales bacterium]|jgi:thiosulfate dehydrogenase [quinone] large subunit|nr:DoxX [Bacillales bacterium]